MSVEDLHKKLQARLSNFSTPTPCQIKRQIEEARINQALPPQITELQNSNPELFKKLLEFIQTEERLGKREHAINLIRNSIRPDGSVDTKNLKRELRKQSLPSFP